VKERRDKSFGRKRKRGKLHRNVAASDSGSDAMREEDEEVLS